MFATSTVETTTIGWTVLNRVANMFIFAMFSVGAISLRNIKKGGHKTLFLNAAILLSLRAVLAGVALVGMVLPVSHWIVNSLIAFSAVSALWLAMYAVSSWDDVKQTVCDSEWLNRLRSNKDEDRAQARMFMLTQAATARQGADALYARLLSQ